MADNSTHIAQTPVAIVGAGPVGLSLALGLARHGVRSVLLERKAETSRQSKAGGIHTRTREIFRQWGVEERFLDAGVLRRALEIHNAGPGRRVLTSADFSELEAEADDPGVLFLEQGETERLLLAAVQETGMCDVRFGAEAIGLSHGADGAGLRVREAGEERSLDAEFVVGCDGASSFVRTTLGLPFDGITYSLRPMLADVRVRDERDSLPWPRMRNAPRGLTFTFRLPSGLWRIVRIERGEAGKGEGAPEEEVDECVSQLLGEGPVEIAWASRFRIHLRSSPRFRDGRVLLAGDAAHVHSPAGGLGMNGGIQDAHNLAWKLAYALPGGDVDRLLDSYDVERRAVIVGSVSRSTDLVTRAFLQMPSALRNGVFFLMRVAFMIGPARRRNLRRTAMIDLDYPQGSPLLDRRERAAGVRLPNPKLRSPEGKEVRLYDLLPNGPVLLDVGAGDAPHDGLPVERVIRIGGGGYVEPRGMVRGLLGGKDGLVLVRPDAHVAWARNRGDGIDEALAYALGTG